MVQIYNLGIFFYLLFIRAASVFNKKAKLFVEGRKNWEGELRQKVIPGEKYSWFHCASLGEFEQCRPVIEELKSKHPEYKILLSFFSPSGYEVRKNYSAADIVCYLPIDTKKNARRFLDITRPEKVLFVKYEFWHHFIKEIKNRGIPLFAISAIFRENQLFFKSSPWGKWFRKMLNGFEHFFVQNKKSGELLAKTGLTNYTVAGDTRFDRVAKIAEHSKELPIIEKFKNGNPLIVIGSSWKADEELLINYINHTSEVKFIIAPHEVSEANISRIEQSLKRPSIRYSIADRNHENTQVLIIDSIGLLSSVYKYGEIAYIGGGFGIGIHNILEAAAYGMPVIFGPNFEKFDEAYKLTRLGGAFSIKNYSSLETILNGLVNNQEKLDETTNITRQFVKNNTGATSVILKKVFNI